eukprot:TRINITY_DN66553_c0_g1_i1.p1 TRINITY_DN66553_c0_g1~~TRINITY_DN66553_c0_g1_i1.p1  ORF type:complete len:348 (+),score=90.41 TRINITY_DN66553_c0_g1_i1:155-1198(+)
MAGRRPGGKAVQAADAFKYMDEMVPGWEHGPAAKYISKGLKDGVSRGEGGSTSTPAGTKRPACAATTPTAASSTPARTQQLSCTAPTTPTAAASSTPAGTQKLPSTTTPTAERRKSEPAIEATPWQRKLAEQEVRRIIKDKADSNSDGVLDMQELKVLMTELGMDPKHVGALISAADKNNDGVLSAEEFLDWMFKGTASGQTALRVALEVQGRRNAPRSNVGMARTRKDGGGRNSTVSNASADAPAAPPTPAGSLTKAARTAAAEEVRKIFSLSADTDKNGFLDIAELAYLMERLGMDREQASKLMKAADKNNDKHLTTQEFLDWLFSGTKMADVALANAAAKASKK